MEEQEKKPTRKGSPAIKVRVLPEEKAAIERVAAEVGLSASAYLRQVGMDFEPRSLLDREAARDLLRATGDLGRLGGLLKLWLTDDAKLAEMAGGYRQAQRHIRTTLTKIEEGQEELRAIVDRLIRSQR